MPGPSSSDSVHLGAAMTPRPTHMDVFNVLKPLSASHVDPPSFSTAGRILTFPRALSPYLALLMNHPTMIPSFTEAQRCQVAFSRSYSFYEA